MASRLILQNKEKGLPLLFVFKGMNYLKIKKGVILRKRSCKFKQDIDVIAILPNNDILALDKDVFAFLSHCNGFKSIKDLEFLYKKIFKSKIKLNESILKDYYLEKIIECVNKVDPINKNQILETKELTSACRNVIWHLNQKCNLNCQHCYYISQKSRKKEFTYNEIRKIVNNLCKLGIEKVTITGGEPTLNPNKLEFVANLLKEKCIPFHINTNASNNVNIIAKVFSDNPYAKSVQVSIDGLKSCHEKFRGKKHIFNKTLNNVKKMISQGINVKIISMINKDWIGKEKEIFRLIDNLNVKQWLIEIPVKVGKWEKNYTEYDLNKEQLKKIFKNFINLIKREKHNFEFFTISQVYNWPECQDFKNKKISDPICYHHLGMLSFGPEGVSFCTPFSDKFGKSLYKIAPAYSDDIKKIWNKIVNVRLSHRLKDNKYCKKCNLFKYCQGGCPGRYEFSEKFSGCDEHSKLLAEIKKEIKI